MATKEPRGKSDPKAPKKRNVRTAAPATQPNGLGWTWAQIKQRPKRALFVAAMMAMVSVMIGGLLLTIQGQSTVAHENRQGSYSHAALGAQLRFVNQSIDALAADQQHEDIAITDIAALRDKLAIIRAELIAGKRGLAHQHLMALDKQVTAARAQLAAETQAHKAVKAATPSPATAPSGTTLPILIYHETPGNFEQQLQHLIAHGYHAITMQQAYDGLAGVSPLPSKPVAITFDDGFSNQLQAFDLLKKYHMPATFYIIDAGEASRWCIGSGRRYGDPSQPPGGCGDSYLNWDEVRALDRSGLIEIGGHTVNHRNLAGLSPADQQFEIANGKQQLEAQVGHSVTSFAYPYGAYNATSVQVARAAGYTNAVTTASGTTQSSANLMTLNRVRDALLLP